MENQTESSMYILRQKRRLRHKQKLRKSFWHGVIFTLVAELVIAFFIVPIASSTYRKYFPIIENGHLMRNFSEVRKYLPDEPEDLNSVPYETQIPTFIQNDIDKMLDKPEIQDIVYQSKDGLSKVIIYASQSGRIGVSAYDVDYSGISHLHNAIEYDISFYKTENGFNIYGRDEAKNRQLVSYYLDEEFVGEEIFYQSSIDLLGVDSFQKNPDNVYFWRDNRDLTLTRNGNEFTFYHKGKQYGDTVEFPGADIININDDYIMDSNKDLYYMYYCASLKSQWIHFEKVTESIDEMTGKYVEVGYRTQDPMSNSIHCYTYSKNGKTYAAVPDLETELAYGQTYGKWRDFDNVMEPNYEVQTIEISNDTIKEIRLCRSGFSNLILVQHLYGENSDVTIYEEHILRGIDTYIDVPEEEIAPLLGALRPEEYDERIQAIKAVYQKYESNY